MASSEQEDIVEGENGNVTRRTRSGKCNKKSPGSVPMKTKKGKKLKMVSEDVDDMKDDGLEAEDSEDLDSSIENKNDQSRVPGEESNGSIDKSSFENNIIQTEGKLESVPFEPMDISIVDSAKDSENTSLEFDEQDDTPPKEIVQDENNENSIRKSNANFLEDTSKQNEKSDADEKSSVVEDVEKVSKENDEILEFSIKDDCSNKVNTEDVSDETEVVSEDELPLVEKPEVKDAENVSDDELPGPKPADLPADTEVVSEDELPSSKKEVSRKRKISNTAEVGYDPGSPTSEGESTAKKPTVAKESENKSQSSERRASDEKPAKKKALPELDKYWKAVNDDATDFTGWTYLLQYVDQENDVEAAREAYDAFLSHYPYCYGYWRKYADYEKRKGSKKKCLEVLERGLRGIPLSVDLWIHHLNHIKSTRAEDLDYIRQQYERAIGACGLEFRSDRLWESYIKWETENGTLPNVTALYDRLLATPTLGYTSHFDNFQEHIMSHAPNMCVPVAEFLQLRTEIRSELKNDPPLDSDPDIPPGEEEADDHVRSEEEGFAIKERIISARRKIHKLTVDQVAQRWNFEEGIKRPYFHVKPLERCQLKNWKAYLEWEEQRQDHNRTIVLYERCLIACALYEEFWIRLVQYLENRTATVEEEAEKAALVVQTRDVLERACTIHHLERPALHIRWAAFEEHNGAPAKAADILDKLDKACPNLLQVACRRINLERRRGDLDKCCQLYENYISQSKSKGAASTLAIKFGRFLVRVRRDPATACKVLRAQAARDPTCQRLYLQMVDITLSTPDYNLQQAIGYFDEYLGVEGIDNESRLLFMQRKAELLEELGDKVSDIQPAITAYQVMAKQHHKKKNKEKGSSSDSNSGSSKKKGDNTQAPPLPPNATPASTSTGTNYNSGNYSANYGPGYSAGAPPPQGQQPGPPYEGGTGYTQQPYHQWGPTYQQPPYHNPWNPYPNYY